MTLLDKVAHQRLFLRVGSELGNESATRKIHGPCISRARARARHIRFYSMKHKLGCAAVRLSRRHGFNDELYFSASLPLSAFPVAYKYYTRRLRRARVVGQSRAKCDIVRGCVPRGISLSCKKKKTIVGEGSGNDECFVCAFRQSRIRRSMNYDGELLSGGGGGDSDSSMELRARARAVDIAMRPINQLLNFPSFIIFSLNVYLRLVT